VNNGVVGGDVGQQQQQPEHDHGVDDERDDDDADDDGADDADNNDNNAAGQGRQRDRYMSRLQQLTGLAFYLVLLQFLNFP